MTNRERTPQHEVGESGSSGGIGMRDQISATIARARAAIRLSRERAERSRAIVDVSGFVVEEAQRATDASRRIRAELRESVVAYVRDLRAQGVPSERMLVLVKAAVREATRRRSSMPTRRARSWRTSCAGAWTLTTMPPDRSRATRETMTRRDVRGIPATCRDVDELRHELELLLERTAQARDVCAASAVHVKAACAQSIATRESVRASRQQWQAWRTGLAAALSRAAERRARATLHRCETCEAVRFAVGAAEAPPDASAAPAEWIVPPAMVRTRLRIDWTGLVIVPATCPRCAAVRDGGAALAPDASTDPETSDDAEMLGRLLDDISDAATAIAARCPSLDEEQALELAIETIVGSGWGDGPPDVSLDDMAALGDALRALARALREGAADDAVGVVRGLPQRSGHFRPTLRPR
ncbi:hypothetical protein J421_2237 [Gemmatirosa kalamazoonensis]|uniref:Uncharacterized protein n=1 Tax=Gemmatirosa kalamazoonensis TaxID=861299 RepID=W0RFB8_9BACT|nr:hypothetical protein [Gemmatirosa kalamazoonensis]AHG89774.1 hypothetical protein J421_2237 [Gemmatirosa kalamazoonensis]